MTNSDKPENDNEPVRKPFAEVLDDAPREETKSTETVVRIGLAALIFVLACVAMFYFWNN